MNRHQTFGSITVVPPDHEGPYVCAIKVTTSDDGMFAAVSLEPDQARSIAMRLLSCAGAINPKIAARETTLGARH